MTGNIHVTYFSPTGTTKLVLEHMAKTLDTQLIWNDFTPYHADYTTMQFSHMDSLIVGFPVYSGRVPDTFIKRISLLKGNRTPAVIVATYGNRDYDDALIEMKTLLVKQGFLPIAAAAFVTEHNMYRTLAAGRPDHNDLLEIAQFTTSAFQKIIAMEPASEYHLQVKGNVNYRQYLLMPMQPHSTSNCSQCGICAKLCPAGAIPSEHPEQTDNERCIRCMACVHFCPVHARDLSEGQKRGAQQHLDKYCECRRDNETFLID